jgi:predicted RNA binding protein YcfA (HicA-like mRNA interferase family)
VNRRALIRHLARQGCLLAREGARHSIYANPTNGRTAPVPRHTEIADLLARKICDQLDIAPS